MADIRVILNHQYTFAAGFKMRLWFIVLAAAAALRLIQEVLQIVIQTLNTRPEVSQKIHIPAQSQHKRAY